MRISILAAASSLALIAGAASAQAPGATPIPAQTPAPAASADASAITDAELASFAGAMTRMQTVAQAVGSGTPTAEQQAEMAAAVEESGLEIDRFNAISTAVSGDPVLQARVAVAATPPSAAGSVGAGVTDAEAAQFATAMTRMQAVAEAVNGGTPSAEQQAEMASAVEDSGLSIDRFNEISTAVPADPSLQARLALAVAQSGQ